eukprot:Pgem_evm2s18283
MLSFLAFICFPFFFQAGISAITLDMFAVIPYVFFRKRYDQWRGNDFAKTTNQKHVHSKDNFLISTIDTEASNMKVGGVGSDTYVLESYEADSGSHSMGNDNSHCDAFDLSIWIIREAASSFKLYFQ